MTIAEYLQQFVDAAKNGNIFFVLSKTSGDPKGTHHGEIWGGTGTLQLDSQGDTFTGSFEFSQFSTASPQQPYQLDIKLVVSSAQLTLVFPPENLIDQFYADHAQLEYSNGGVLYGVISRIKFDQSKGLFDFEPGPVVTLALQAVEFLKPFP